MSGLYKKGELMKRFFICLIFSCLCVFLHAQVSFEEVHKGALQGNAEYQTYLGWMYLTGTGTTKNESEAFKWMIKAAEQGNADAQHYLGIMYGSGKGTALNQSEGFKWMLKAAGQGKADAQYIVALCLFQGTGTIKNDIQAFKWMLKAAELGKVEAQRDLGKMYFYENGVAKNEKESFKWTMKAAEAGDVESQLMIGYYYSKGLGVEENQKESVRWNKMAAEAGNATAQSNLSIAYRKGKGVDIDYEQAFYWAEKSAKQESEYGYEELSACFLVGSKKNTIKALECLDKAIEICKNTKNDKIDKNYLLRKYNAKGIIYLDDKNFVKAEGMAKLIMDINPQYQDENDNRLMVYMQTGEIGVDKASLAQTKRLKPSSDVDLTVPKGQQNNSNTFAIIIANENYEEETQVEYALNDGEIFKTYCRDVLGLPETNIHYRENATLNNFLAELDWMKQISFAFGNEAKFIFYYAGHGIPDEASGDSYLLPVDGRGNLLATGYSLKKLYDTLGGLGAKSVTVFMDACFSGSVRNGEMMASARGVAIKAKQAAPKGNMIVLSAAQGDETAYPYKEKGHGLFTYFLLKKLQETKGDVTIGVLADYVTSEVKKRSIVVNGKLQTPIVTHSNGAVDWRNWKLK